MKTCLEIDDIVDDYYNPTPCCMTHSPPLCYLTMLYDTQYAPFMLSTIL